MSGDALERRFARTGRATEMPTSIEEFKTAFASSPSADDGGDLEKKVDGALKALKRAVANIPPDHTSADGFGRVLVELVTRYKSAREKANSTPTAVLEEVRRQANTMLDRVQAILENPPTSRDAPARPTDTDGADRKPELPRTGGAGDGGPAPAPTAPATVNVTITVVDTETNAAINGAVVELAGQSVKTTNAGLASFSLPAGDYEYRVSQDGYRAASGPIQVKDADVQQQVQLQSLARGIDIDGDVARAARLHAKFEKQTNPTEKGKIARELIKLAGELEKRLSQAHRDTSGMPILSGNVQFDPQSKGSLAGIPPFNSRDQWAAAVSVLNLEVLVLAPDAKGKNQPLKSAIVRFKDSQGTEQSEVTGEDGWVAFQAAAGKYDCEVSYPRYGKLQQTIELLGGGRKLEVVLRPPPPGPAGAPDLVSVGINVSDYAAATVDISNARVTLGKTTKSTDANGIAWFRVKPGVWTYTAVADNYLKETGDIDVPNSKDPVSQVVFLKSTVERSGDLLVKVLEAGTRKPIPGAKIRVSSEQEVSDSHGEARFLRVPFDAQSIIVGGVEGYKYHSSAFHHTREYATKFLEIELEPEAKP